jgi:hypothetical protein
MLRLTKLIRGRDAFFNKPQLIRPTLYKPQNTTSQITKFKNIQQINSVKKFNISHTKWQMCKPFNVMFRRPFSVDSKNEKNNLQVNKSNETSSDEIKMLKYVAWYLGIGVCVSFAFCYHENEFSAFTLFVVIWPLVVALGMCVLLPMCFMIQMGTFMNKTFKKRDDHI